jgi:hypothetical protein
MLDTKQFHHWLEQVETLLPHSPPILTESGRQLQTAGSCECCFSRSHCFRFSQKFSKRSAVIAYAHSLRPTISLVERSLVLG